MYVYMQLQNRQRENKMCVGKLLTNLTKNSNNKKEEELPLFSILYRKGRWSKKHAYLEEG